jgi:Flp pilus assembly protein TadD/TolB-like protein
VSCRPALLLRNYNGIILQRFLRSVRTWRSVLLFPALLGVFLPAVAQQTPAADSRSLLILPFENVSKAPGIEWIGEAFPEVMGDRLRAPGIYVVTREERLYAFDRMGIPAGLKPSRATLYRVAEQMDTDFVVLGRYNFDGQHFTATANVLDMKQLRMSANLVQSGPLPGLMEIEDALAWDVMRIIHPEQAGDRAAFLAASSPVRLDALENYIRAMLASNRPEKLQRLKEAVRLNPQYDVALLALGKTYFEARDYPNALAWLSKVSRQSVKAREAAFYAGLAAFYSGDFARAEDQFAFVASQLPLNEVYNNLGAAQARRGKRTAADYFQRAVQAEPEDPDYHFNLAVTLFRNGDQTAALRQAREAAALHPGDSDTKQLLDALNSGATYSSLQNKAPVERLKRNYDESSFQQVELEVQKAIEARWAGEPPARHARFHVERGRDLLNDGLVSEAEQNFREALQLQPKDPQAHAALATALERKGDFSSARSEAQAALRLAESAEAYVVLTRLEMRENNLEAARADVQRALTLQPSNGAALLLQREIASRAPGGAAAQPR